LHTLSASFVLGYHGCDEKVAEAVLSGKNFRKSQNKYDWLGHGIYFWEANPLRGLEFAQEVSHLSRGPNIKYPTVLGAVIDLGYCLDLTTSSGARNALDAFVVLKGLCKKNGTPLPENSTDGLRRNLDCEVIETLHDIQKEQNLEPIDSVKGVFVEGDPVYPGAAFYNKTHIQICIRNHDCIKGVFRVPKSHLQ